MQLIAERPVTHTGEDRLFFQAYAEVLAASMLADKAPACVGIFGEWGTGKSSLMHLVEGAFDRVARGRKVAPPVVVRFNAWAHQLETHPVLPMLRTIADELGKRAGEGATDPTIADRLRTLATGLYSLLAAVKVKGDVNVPLLGRIGLEVDGSKLPQGTRSPSAPSEGLYTAVATALAAHAAGLDQRVVVFVDDVDRCSPQTCLNVLESLKLAFGNPNYVFVLGVSEGFLLNAVTKAYEPSLVNPASEARRFIDKIVDLQFRMPPHHDRMGKFTLGLTLQPGAARLKPVEQLIADAGRGNPRATIRFANNLLLDDAVVDSLMNRKGLETRPTLGVLAVTRALQTEWREVYEELRRSPRIRRQVLAWEPNAGPLGASLEKFSPAARLAAVLDGDEALTRILKSAHGTTWLRDDEQRDRSVSLILDGDGKRPASEARTFAAFLSYRMPDREGFIRPIAEALEKRDLRLSWKGEFNVGTNWQRTTDRALQNSRALLSFISPRSLETVWMKREAERATELAALDPAFRIIPVLLPGATAEHMPEVLKEWIWFEPLSTAFVDRDGNVQPGESFDAAVAELANLLLDDAVSGAW